jgi:hypothetical protein
MWKTYKGEKITSKEENILLFKGAMLFIKKSKEKKEEKTGIEAVDRLDINEKISGLKETLTELRDKRKRKRKTAWKEGLIECIFGAIEEETKQLWQWEEDKLESLEKNNLVKDIELAFNSVNSVNSVGTEDTKKIKIDETWSTEKVIETLEKIKDRLICPMQQCYLLEKEILDAEKEAAQLLTMFLGIDLNYFLDTGPSTKKTKIEKACKFFRQPTVKKRI